MRSFREFGKKVLPERLIDRYRRRRAVHLYLRSLGYELVEVGRTDPEELRERMRARTSGSYEVMLKDLLERTDLVMQQLDRKIEGVQTRHGRELRELRAELAEAREAVLRLQSAAESARASPVRAD